MRSPGLRSSSSYHSASVPAAKSRTISPGSASPLSTSSLTRFAMCCASARRQWTSVPEYDDLSVTSSSTGEPNTGSGNSPDEWSGWNSSPNSPAKSSFTTASTSGRER